MSDTEIITYFEINNNIYHIFREFDHNYLQPAYQTQFLNKIYKNKSMLSIVSYLEIDKYQYALNSFILLL